MMRHLAASILIFACLGCSDYESYAKHDSGIECKETTVYLEDTFAGRVLASTLKPGDLVWFESEPCGVRYLAPVLDGGIRWRLTLTEPDWQKVSHDEG